MLIGGLEYHISEENFDYLPRSLGGGSKSAYFSIGETWYDKRHIRVYNHHTKEHFFLEKAWPKVGDSNLLFVDFPRSDGPADSWCKTTTQHANITSWSDSAKNRTGGDYVRFTIKSIGEDNYCRVDDGYNASSGSYALDSFYKISKILKP